MLQDVELQTITVSDAAAKAIRDIVQERKLEGYALRVYMAGSGCCSGVSFGMALDNNVRDVDRTFDSGGVRVVVDQVSMDYLNGAKIDFVNDPQRGAGFRGRQPVCAQPRACSRRGRLRLRWFLRLQELSRAHQYLTTSERPVDYHVDRPFLVCRAPRRHSDSVHRPRRNETIVPITPIDPEIRG